MIENYLRMIFILLVIIFFIRSKFKTSIKLYVTDKFKFRKFSEGFEPFRFHCGAEVQNRMPVMFIPRRDAIGRVSKRSTFSAEKRRALWRSKLIKEPRITQIASVKSVLSVVKK